MASAPAEESSQPTLPYQTWVLKVSIHCQGCERKVKKVLRSIEGVYTTDIDSQLHKVTVTGNIDAQTLIKKLVKTGKHTELWPEKPANGKEKKPGKANENEKKNDSKSNDDSEEEEENPPENNNSNLQGKISSPRVNSGSGGGPTVKFMGVDPVDAENKPLENVTGAEKPPAEPDQMGSPAGGGGGGGPGGKKKKKKGRKGNSNSNAGAGTNGAPASTGMEVPKVGFTQAVDQMNPGPTSENVCHYPPQQAYVVSYNAAYPRANVAPGYHYMPPSYAQPEIYPVQSAPLDSFEILSDENPNGCFIM